MNNNIDQSILNLVQQIEHKYIQIYSNYKLCSFYGKYGQESLENNNLNRLSQTIEDIYRHNKLLDCNDFNFDDEFQKQVLKKLNMKAITCARQCIIQGRRNKYIKELLADDPIDE